MVRAIDGTGAPQVPHYRATNCDDPVETTTDPLPCFWTGFTSAFRRRWGTQLLPNIALQSTPATITIFAPAFTTPTVAKNMASNNGCLPGPCDICSILTAMRYAHLFRTKVIGDQKGTTGHGKSAFFMSKLRKRKCPKTRRAAG
jgi:hypothetical protein